MERLVTGRRILAEIERELTRPTGRWSPVAALLFAGAFALFAVVEAGAEIYVLATYVFLPMLAAPLAAHRMAGDRERGLARVTATTPIDTAVFLTGKLIALHLLLVASLALTLPILYALTETMAPGAFHNALPFLGWALLTGTLSILVGLLIGYAKQGASAAALSIAFSTVIAWAFLATQRHRFLAWADNETELAVIQAILHLSPMTWALEADQPAAVGLVSHHHDLALGLVLLLIPILGALAAIALGLQHLDGWLADPTRHPFAILLLATSLIGAGTALALFDYSRPDEGGPDVPDEHTAGIGEMDVAFEASRSQPWEAQTPLFIELNVQGPPNATVTLQELTLEGPHITARHMLEMPTQLHLDEIQEGRGQTAPQNGTYGTATLSFDATATPHRIASMLSLQAHLQLDGNDTTLTTRLNAFDWEHPITPTLAAASAPFALTATTALVLPRRLNRW